MSDANALSTPSAARGARGPAARKLARAAN